jgi:1,4-alpha-glucan branching enzyme
VNKVRKTKKEAADSPKEDLSWLKWTSIKPKDMQVLNDFMCADPFSILGSHPISKGSKISIRVFISGAKAISGQSLDESRKFDFVKLGNSGFFEAQIEEKYEHFLYRLNIELENGVKYSVLDPYAFPPVLTDFDLHLMQSGVHYELYRKLGANLVEVEGIRGTLFSVWAPNARSASVIGNFNSWDGHRHQMRVRGGSGVWEIFVPEIGEGELYRFELHSKEGNMYQKADPLAKLSELRPNTASIVTHMDEYEWGDDLYMRTHSATQVFGRPMNIYEIHPGSWRRDPNNPGRFLNWDEIGDYLIPYATEMGYTHLELMPVMEHPLDQSWGYQVTGYFSPTSRYGTPDQFRRFVDRCHQANIGVLLDWVPAHFPKDGFSLGRFDGSPCYEHADPRQGEHPHWGTYIFNYGRQEVSNFLISNAMYWLREFHADGLRIDAVASMLYLDYGRNHGEWIPNKDGGNVNYDTVQFLKHLNSIMGKQAPHAILIAEESTSFANITRPPEQGGLGFHYKWNMGWMNDFLSYISKEPIHRKYHHNNLTFSMIYAYSENFILVLSHDEVVHGKGSMLSKMPGDCWQQFANLRLAYSYMYAHPGKKLLFMGSEFGQGVEWSESSSLDWHLLGFEVHNGLHNMMRTLGGIYKQEPAFWEIDHHYTGFEWISCDDVDNSVVSFFRRSSQGEIILCVFNFTPVPRLPYRVGAPVAGKWVEIFNSDSQLWGGGNIGNAGEVWTNDIPSHGRPCSIDLNAPPLGAVYLKKW